MTLGDLVKFEMGVRFACRCGHVAIKDALPLVAALGEAFRVVDVRGCCVACGSAVDTVPDNR